MKLQKVSNKSHVERFSRLCQNAELGLVVQYEHYVVPSLCARKVSFEQGVITC